MTSEQDTAKKIVDILNCGTTDLDRQTADKLIAARREAIVAAQVGAQGQQPAAGAVNACQRLGHARILPRGKLCNMVVQHNRRGWARPHGVQCRRGQAHAHQCRHREDAPRSPQAAPARISRSRSHESVRDIASEHSPVNWS